MTDILNALVLLSNFVLIPALSYGAQLALGALGVTLIYAVLRFSNFAHGDTMAFGTMATILVTWWLQSQGVGLGPLPTALIALPALKRFKHRFDHRRYNGATLLGLGFHGRRRILRHAGLGVVALAFVRLFFWDLANSDSVYRIAALIGTAIIALGVSWLYQRFLSEEDKS